MFFKNLIFFITSLFISCTTFAGLYLEPYAGSISGKMKASAALGAATSETESTESTVVYGGRLGLSFVGLSFGADYLTGGGDNPISDIGAFVRYQFPVLVNVSASYFPSSQVQKIQVNSVEETGKGNAYKVGLGFRLFPFVSLNADYIKHTWNDIPLHGLTSLEVNYDSYLVSLSFPISI